MHSVSSTSPTARQLSRQVGLRKLIRHVAHSQGVAALLTSLLYFKQK